MSGCLILRPGHPAREVISQRSLVLAGAALGIDGRRSFPIRCNAGAGIRHRSCRRGDLRVHRRAHPRDRPRLLPRLLLWLVIRW
jgi:hypothetical protein